MKECKHALPPDQCASCLGTSHRFEIADFDSADYVVTFQEQGEIEDAFAQWHKVTGGHEYQEVPQMGIRAAGTQVRLDEFVGKLVGLRYLGSDRTVDTAYGTRVAARAEIVDLDEGKSKGVSLIFQEAIANELRSQGSDWVVGTLVHGEHPTKPEYTMFLLDSEGLDMEAVLAGFGKAGIDPDA